MKPSISPDGRYTLEIDTYEMRMSHWVNAIRIVDNTTGHTVLDLHDTLWSASDEEWQEKGRALRLHLRRYPGNRAAVGLTLNFETGLAEIETDSFFVELPFRDVYSWLEKNVTE